MGSHKKLDKIICCDIELTCWSNKEEQGNQSSEIIQIGLFFLNIANKQIEKQLSYYIKPKYSTISNYCTALTGITPKIAKGAMPLSDACNSIIKTFGARNRAFATFGDDKTKFRSDCLLKNAEYPFSNHAIDVSLLFHIKHGLNKNNSLKECLNIIGFGFEGQQHNALYDAVNTARLLQHLIY